MSMIQRPTRLFAAALALALVACGPLPGSGGKHRYGASEKDKDLGKLETPGLVIGEFTLAPKPVVDGDTIKVKGLGASLRLLGIDTEETFKHENERRAFEGQPFDAYLEQGRGDSKHPVKMPTPLGEDAKRFAQDFFKDVKTVRLERDHPKEIRDFYNRYLAYVFAYKDGKWVNYNVEAVRAGMSPYFSKYGYSRRFHAEFVAAQEEARKAGRGIWDPNAKHYADYDERLAWWNQRAEEIAAFEKQAEGKDDWIALTRWDALDALTAHLGKEVVLLGAVSDIRPGDKGPTRVMLSRRLHEDFALVFFDKDVFGTSGLDKRIGEYIAVRGVVSKYKDRRGRESLQIVVNLPDQVFIPGNAPPATMPADEADAPEEQHAPQ